MFLIFIYIYFWAITMKYISRLLYLFPITLQQINPSDRLSIQVLIRIIMASLGLTSNLTIKSFLEKKRSSPFYPNIKLIFFIVLIKPIFWMNMTLIAHFSNCIHMPQLRVQFRITRFIKFNLLLIIFFITLINKKHKIHHNSSLIIIFTIIFLPNLSSIIAIFPIIALLEIKLFFSKIIKERGKTF